MLYALLNQPAADHRDTLGDFLLTLTALKALHALEGWCVAVAALAKSAVDHGGKRRGVLNRSDSLELVVLIPGSGHLRGKRSGVQVIEAGVLQLIFDDLDEFIDAADHLQAGEDVSNHLGVSDQHLGSHCSLQAAVLLVDDIRVRVLAVVEQVSDSAYLHLLATIEHEARCDLIANPKGVASWQQARDGLDGLGAFAHPHGSEHGADTQKLEVTLIDHTGVRSRAATHVGTGIRDQVLDRLVFTDSWDADERWENGGHQVALSCQDRSDHRRDDHAFFMESIGQAHELLGVVAKEACVDIEIGDLVYKTTNNCSVRASDEGVIGGEFDGHEQP